MGYLHIPNLYKSQEILAFKQAYALEKIHGTSAHVHWDDKTGLSFFSGGESHDRFTALFDKEALTAAFTKLDQPVVFVFGEAYGGKQQGMSATYGKELKFVAFDVRLGELWLAVPQAADVAVRLLGLEFVHYDLIDTSFDAINAARDADSVQAVRNGVGPGLIREGIVLRSPFEVVMNNGDRVIAKHKRDEFRETAKPRDVAVDPARLTVLADAEAVALEWATMTRMAHVMQAVSSERGGAALGAEQTGDVIKAMVADVQREGAGEIVWSKDVQRAVVRRAAELFKAHLRTSLESGPPVG